MIKKRLTPIAKKTNYPPIHYPPTIHYPLSTTKLKKEDNKEEGTPEGREAGFARHASLFLNI